MGKQVKTPRFYVDMVTFLHATGQLGWDDGNGGAELLYMNCANPYTKQIDTTGPNEVARIGDKDDNTTKTSFPVNFCALLNHNLAFNTNTFKFYGKHGLTSDTTDVIFEPINQILNSNNSSTEINPTYNGTTIFDFDSNNEYWRAFSVYYGNENPIDVGTQQLGSMVVGKYFDCPNSPDLNLTMSRRFDGIKRQRTVGGKTLANIYYDGPTEWTMNNADGTTYKYPPFELDTTGDEFNQRVKSGIGRKGLRSWKLTFSYISESDMWIDHEVSNNIISDSLDPNDDAPSPMLSDNSFNFVWNCTLGGTLPFIFQADNSEDGRNPDRFAICNFRENSLSVQQVAFNTYKVSMTIDEIA